MGKLIWSAYPVEGGHIVKAVDGNYGVCWGLPTGEPLVGAIEAIYAEHGRKAECVDSGHAYREKLSDGRRALHKEAGAGALSGDMAAGKDSVREARRSAFERWAKERMLDIHRDGVVTDYALSLTDFLWNAWNAALDSVCVVLPGDITTVAGAVLWSHEVRTAIQGAGIRCEVAK